VKYDTNLIRYNTDHYAYRVVWSEEDQEHVALCSEFPSLVHRQELNVGFGEVFTEVRKARKVRSFSVLCYLERPSVKQDSKSVTEH
jgi:hypothetical protein